MKVFNVPEVSGKFPEGSKKVPEDLGKVQGRFLNRFESSVLSISQELRSACLLKLRVSIILVLLTFVNCFKASFKSCHRITLKSHGPSFPPNVIHIMC